jgi:hypothetical protein
LSNRLDAPAVEIAGDASTLNQTVRQPDPMATRAALSKDLISSPAHPSNGLIAQLNGNWRVVHDPLQWILQRRKGNARKKNSG